MKTVFPGRQVCHVWAQQTQATGRNSTNTIFFDGPSIYSYGRHFEMARFIGEAVLVNCAKYSVTTAKHLSWVRQAVTHRRIFEVPSMTDHAVNVTYLIEQSRKAYDQAVRARKYVDNCIAMGREYVDQIQRYVDLFHVAVPRTHTDLWAALIGDYYLNSETQAELFRKAREAKEKTRAENEARQQRRIAEEQEDLEKWIRGEFHGYRYFTQTYLRVSGNEVQTSHGASVPLIEARKLYRAMKARLDITGQRVGHFTVTSLTEQCLNIGCHCIPVSEIERIAPQVMAEQ